LLLIGFLLAGLYFSSLIQEAMRPSHLYETVQQTDSTGSLGLQNPHHPATRR
jgi:hypothetical protein